MSHKQLYTKTVHLNLPSITEMGMLPVFIRDNSTSTADINDYFNSVLRISTTPDYTDLSVLIPKKAKIVSMTAENKYFFAYEQKGISSVLPVTFEPFITTMHPLYGLYPNYKILYIFIKGPTKEQIPDVNKLYSVLKTAAIDRAGFCVGNISFDLEHLINIDLVINYTLPD